MHPPLSRERKSIRDALKRALSNLQMYDCRICVAISFPGVDVEAEDKASDVVLTRLGGHGTLRSWVRATLGGEPSEADLSAFRIRWVRALIEEFSRPEGVPVPVARLMRRCNPYGASPWGAAPLKRSLVRDALKERRLVNIPGTTDHYGRIAYLVENPAPDPIEIDVGIPALQSNLGWMVVDGNHRFAAAIFAKRQYINANISGDLDHANRLLSLSL